MKKEIENIIVSKSFDELSAVEKNTLKDYAVTEKEYFLLKSILLSAPRLHSDVMPSAELKKELMQTFKAKHSVVSSVKSTRSKIKIISWSSIAALFLLALLVYPFINDSKWNNSLAKVERKDAVKPENLTKKIEESPADPIEKSLETSVSKPERTVKQQNNNPQLTQASILEDKNITENVESIVPSNIATTINNESSELLGKSTHSDRLFYSDLPEKSRQIIADQPTILDVLYTSF